MLKECILLVISVSSLSITTSLSSPSKKSILPPPSTPDLKAVLLETPSASEHQPQTPGPARRKAPSLTPWFVPESGLSEEFCLITLLETAVHFFRRPRGALRVVSSVPVSNLPPRRIMGRTADPAWDEHTKEVTKEETKADG